MLEKAEAGEPILQRQHRSLCPFRHAGRQVTLAPSRLCHPQCIERLPDGLGSRERRIVTLPQGVDKREKVGLKADAYKCADFLWSRLALNFHVITS